MSVFRLQDNTPQVYQSESRDFQMLSRVMDTLHGGVMNDITSMQNLTRPRRIYDSMLTYYASKVGFFPNRSIDAKVLRYILAAFPYIIKYKGTKKGIEMAVTAVIKAENHAYGKDSIYVSVDKDAYTIKVETLYEIYNRNALEELLKYVIPAGYDLYFIVARHTPSEVDYYTQSSKVTLVTSTYYASGARPLDDIPNIGNDYKDKSFNASADTEGVVDENSAVGIPGSTDDLKNYAASSFTTNKVVAIEDISQPAEEIPQ